MKDLIKLNYRPEDINGLKKVLDSRFSRFKLDTVISGRNSVILNEITWISVEGLLPVRAWTKDLLIFPERTLNELFGTESW